MLKLAADRNASVYPPSFQGERRTVPTPESFALNERQILRLHLAVRSEDGHGENAIGARSPIYGIGAMRSAP